jgi:hypothetical protein
MVAATSRPFLKEREKGRTTSSFTSTIQETRVTLPALIGPTRQAQAETVGAISRSPFANNFRLGDNSPGTVRMLFPGRALTVRDVGALSDLDNIAVRIADIAAYLAILGYWFRDELGSSTFP